MQQQLAVAHNELSCMKQQLADMQQSLRLCPRSVIELLHWLETAVPKWALIMTLGELEQLAAWVWSHYEQQYSSRLSNSLEWTSLEQFMEEFRATTCYATQVCSTLRSTALLVRCVIMSPYMSVCSPSVATGTVVWLPPIHCAMLYVTICLLTTGF